MIVQCILCFLFINNFFFIFAKISATRINSGLLSREYFVNLEGLDLQYYPSVSNCRWAVLLSYYNRRYVCLSVRRSVSLSVLSSRPMLGIFVEFSETVVRKGFIIRKSQRIMISWISICEFINQFQNLKRSLTTNNTGFLSYSS